MAEESSEEPKALDKCPNCFSDLNPEDPICPTCSFDTTAGQGLPPSGVDESKAEPKSA